MPVWRARTLVRGTEDGPHAVFLSNEAAAQVRMAGGPWAFLGLQGDTAVFAVDVSGVDDPLPLLPGRRWAGSRTCGPWPGCSPRTTPRSWRMPAG